MIWHDDGQARFYLGDVRECLGELADGSVHCVVTSPPYWGLRDYGVDGQLGLEATPECYVENMVAVFREVKRVLRDDGTLWLNIGDCYHNGDKGGWYGERVKQLDTMQGKHLHSSMGNASPNRQPHPSLKPKDLVGIPWMLAFALRADGWYLRSDIIWSKPNPMPESVTDRPTKAHEYVFLLSKRERYYYDAEAIREAMTGGYANEEDYIKRTNRRAHYEDGNSDPKGGGFRGEGGMSRETVRYNPAGRNKRTVWTIATEPYPEAHFATFPTDLVEPCVLAGTSEHGVCSECGAPWERVAEKEYLSPIVTTGTEEGRYTAGRNRNVTRMGDGVRVTTTGWRPTCKHEASVTASTVLDPFLGSGTTAYVAKKLGRRAIGIDLNENYLQLARRRCAQMGLIS